MIERFVDLFENCTKQGTKIKTDEYKEAGKYIIVDQGQNDIAGYTDETSGVYEDIPAIVFGDHTRVIKYIDKPFFLGADGVKLLKCKRKNANYRYLYYALKNAKIPNTGYNRHYKWLKEIKIMYPDPIRQQRIVYVLDKIEKIMLYRKKQIDKLDDLIKARFSEMFGDPMQNEKQWETRPLLDMGTCKNGMNFHYADKGVEINCLGVGDFKDLSIIEGTSGLPKVSLNEIPSDEYLLKDNDIVFVRSNGNKELVGRCLVVYPRNTLTTFSGFCIRYRKMDEKVHIQYLLRVLKTESMRKKMAGRGANIQNLNQQILGTLIIPIPPMELQEQFGDFAEQVNKSKSAVQKSLDQTQMLFDSLMQQYFG